MMYRRTSIIWISRLCRLFLWSQFCYKYLLVMTKIRSHIPFIKKKKKKKKTAMKSEVKASLRYL